MRAESPNRRIAESLIFGFLFSFVPNFSCILELHFSNNQAFQGDRLACSRLHPTPIRPALRAAYPQLLTIPIMLRDTLLVTLATSPWISSCIVHISLKQPSLSRQGRVSNSKIHTPYRRIFAPENSYAGQAIFGRCFQAHVLI